MVSKGIPAAKLGELHLTPRICPLTLTSFHTLSSDYTCTTHVCTLKLTYSKNGIASYAASPGYKLQILLFLPPKFKKTDICLHARLMWYWRLTQGLYVPDKHSSSGATRQHPK